MEFIIVRAVWDGLPAHSTDDRDIMGTTIRTSDNLAVLRRCVMTTMITEHRIEIYTLIEAHFHTAFNDCLQTRKVRRIVNANVLNVSALYHMEQFKFVILFLKGRNLFRNVAMERVRQIGRDFVRFIMLSN